MTTLLTVEHLTVHFPIRRGFWRHSVDVAHAVDDVSFELARHETLALVGESGSGKTTLARAILQLTKPTGGRIVFLGCDLSTSTRAERRRALSDAQVVYQDPYSSLDPRMTVHDLVAEPLRAHGLSRGRELESRVLALLEMVGLGTQHLWRRPHEFSGGQCQRIAVARALSLEPKLVVLDEPTSALDVSVQARVLMLLYELQRRLGLSYLFIAHDLAVVESMADRVAVMYSGKIVECGRSQDVFCRPLHPYTQALLTSVPSPDPEDSPDLKVLGGDVPSAVHPPSGCRFHPRCRFRLSVCSKQQPLMSCEEDGHFKACHLPVGVWSTSVSNASPLNVGASVETT